MASDPQELARLRWHESALAEVLRWPATSDHEMDGSMGVLSIVAAELVSRRGSARQFQIDAVEFPDLRDPDLAVHRVTLRPTGMSTVREVYLWPEPTPARPRPVWVLLCRSRPPIDLNASLLVSLRRRLREVECFIRS